MLTNKIIVRDNQCMHDTSLLAVLNGVSICRYPHAYMYTSVLRNSIIREQV